MTVVVEVLLRASGSGLDDRVAKRLQAMFCGGKVWADRPFCASRGLAASAWAKDIVLHFYVRPLRATARDVEGYGACTAARSTSLSLSPTSLR